MVLYNYTNYTGWDRKAAGGGGLGMKMLKCLLTDSGVLLLFIVNAIKNRFPEVPAAMCAVLTSLFPM